MTAASQTSVAARMTALLVGQLADFNSLADARRATKTSEEASAGIQIGVMVKKGTADDGALILTTTTSPLAGIVMLENGYDVPNELVLATGYTPKTTFSVLEIGEIAVRVEDAVTPASEVHVRVVTGGTNGYGTDGVGTGETVGAFRGTADSTDCIEITPFARWLTSASAGGIAVLQIDMRNQGLQAAD